MPRRNRTVEKARDESVLESLRHRLIQGWSARLRRGKRREVDEDNEPKPKRESNG